MSHPLNMMNRHPLGMNAACSLEGREETVEIGLATQPYDRWTVGRRLHCEDHLMLASEALEVPADDRLLAEKTTPGFVVAVTHRLPRDDATQAAAYETGETHQAWVVERHHVLGSRCEDAPPRPVRAVDHPTLLGGHLGGQSALVVGGTLDPVGKPADLVVHVVARHPERLTDPIGRGGLS